MWHWEYHPLHFSVVFINILFSNYRRNNFALLNRLPKYGGRDNAGNFRCSSVIRYSTDNDLSSVSTTSTQPNQTKPTQQTIQNRKNHLNFSVSKKRLDIKLRANSRGKNQCWPVTNGFRRRANRLLIVLFCLRLLRC